MKYYSLLVTQQSNHSLYLEQVVNLKKKSILCVKKMKLYYQIYEYCVYYDRFSVHKIVQ
jgi:hypothetical protein